MAVVENDQHVPHLPWFLTEVTAPCSSQLMVFGAPTFFFRLILLPAVIYLEGNELKVNLSFYRRY